MKTLTIPIEGMHCNGCVRSVGNALKNIEGISDAEVSLAEEQALITFSDDSITLDHLRKAVESAGYAIPETAAL